MLKGVPSVGVGVGKIYVMAVAMMMMMMIFYRRMNSLLCLYLWLTTD